MSADLRSEIKRAIWWCRHHRMKNEKGALEVQRSYLRALWKMKQEVGNE